MKEFDRVKEQFDAWTIRLSASRARNTALGDIDEPLIYPEHVSSTQVVERFLKQHPGKERHRAELLEHAKQARPNAVYVMNASLWNEPRKVV